MEYRLSAFRLLSRNGWRRSPEVTLNILGPVASVLDLACCLGTQRVAANSYGLFQGFLCEVNVGAVGALLVIVFAHLKLILQVLA